MKIIIADVDIAKAIDESKRDRAMIDGFDQINYPTDRDGKFWLDLMDLQYSEIRRPSPTVRREPVELQLGPPWDGSEQMKSINLSHVVLATLWTMAGIIGIAMFIGGLQKCGGPLP